MELWILLWLSVLTILVLVALTRKREVKYEGDYINLDGSFSKEKGSLQEIRGWHRGTGREIIGFADSSIGGIEAVNKFFRLKRPVIELFFQSYQGGNDAAGINGFQHLLVDGCGAAGKGDLPVNSFQYAKTWKININL